MFLQATGNYVRLKPSKQGEEIGGTGLTMADFRGFVPKKGEKSELMGEETLNGNPCYVVAVYSKDGNMTGKYWIARKDFAVIKSITFGEGEKPIREFQVLEFFEAKSGKRYPRRQKIIDKQNNTQIELVHEAGVYNVVLPDEVFDPTKFGTVQWRTVSQ